jgi:hypothetical protein
LIGENEKRQYPKGRNNKEKENTDYDSPAQFGIYLRTTKKTTIYMALKIQVLGLDLYNYVARLISLM